MVLFQGIGLHIIESLRAGQRLNRGARISLVLSSRLLYLRQWCECMRTGKGMETSETLSLNDSWYHPGRERDIKYWQGLCVLKWWWRNVCACKGFGVFLLLRSKCVCVCVCVMSVLLQLVCMHVNAGQWWHQTCGYLSLPFLARAWWVVKYFISAGGAGFYWAGVVWFSVQIALGFLVKWKHKCRKVFPINISNKTETNLSVFSASKECQE